MKTNKTFIFLYGVIISALTVSIALGASLALFTESAKSNGSSGEISLHSYYECGTGTEEDPFVITRPRHLYNLSRLQGLGVYDTKKYFALGKVDLGGVDSHDVPMCYVGEGNEMKPYLDMSGDLSNYDTNPINAIGSEAMPFYGVFDGQNVEIKGLTVFASPEDAGLFGYTARGSVIKNLFLDDITINAMGYTDEYANLYSTGSTLVDHVSFNYDEDGDLETTGDVTTYIKTSSTTENDGFFAIRYSKTVQNESTGLDEVVSCFEYNSDPNIENNSPIPVITITHPNNDNDEENNEPNNDYYPLLSGDLINLDEDGNIVPNMEEIFAFFRTKRPASGSENEDDAYPIQTSATASIVVSNIDSLGIKHSKVLLNLKFSFLLSAKNSEFVNMSVSLGPAHSNNIGLIAGHCDGTATDCYVHKGTFKMNNGDEIIEAAEPTYNKVSNGSSIGLIGLVGDSVENIALQEVNDAIGVGTEIGFLNFSDIYSQIIDSHSFDENGDYASGGVTYVPIKTSQYASYLRKNGSTHVTLEDDAVSFKGQEVITSKELGVFTVATDTGTSGAGMFVSTSLEKSVMKKESGLDVNGNYFIYYAMGEYDKQYNTDKSTGITFANYLSALKTDNTDYLLKGNYLPDKDSLSKESFKVREQRQNYIVRFKLDNSEYRTNNGLYFSDVNMDTDGGAFVGNYFMNKLVDRDNKNFNANDIRCGVMIHKLVNRKEYPVSSLDCSFVVPDFSGGAQPKAKVFKNKKYVENTVNFEVNTPYANVTVVAASTEKSKPASLCVYPVNDSDFTGNGTYPQYNKASYNPDYAFFMPTDDHLAYFDYRINNGAVGHKGQIGVYATSSENSFVQADEGTNATAIYKNGFAGEYGYVANSDQTRLYAHTFYLPKGRYCFGSNTNNSADYAKAKIYYVCAQGQIDGEAGYSDTAFGMDKVDKIDFIKKPRFIKSDDEYDGQSQIDVTTPAESYDPSDNKLENQRCYLMLDGAEDKRSSFGNSIPSNITFQYNSNTSTFEITSTLNSSQIASVITRLSLINYNHALPAGDDKEMLVSIFGSAGSTAKTQSYP